MHVELIPSEEPTDNHFRYFVYTAYSKYRVSILLPISVASAYVEAFRSVR